MHIEALKAAKGDCLILHHGTNDDPKLILIDGGPGGVYTAFLKPRLEEIRAERIAAGHIGSTAPLFIDLVMISHIDDDHINGILALFNDIDNGAPFRIGRLWHNSFDSILDANSSQVASASSPASIVTASLSGAILSTGGEEAHDIEMVIASIPQGHDLLLLAKKLQVPVNPEFGGKAIEATDGQALRIDDLSITILGPMKDELDKLRKDFLDWLGKRAAGTATAASLLASFSDTSVANLSSIVLLVDDGISKYLLTGDARADKLIKAASEFGLLNSSQQLPVDLFKVPHHGSDRNNDVKSFKAFPAPWYIFSGNGEHGNPERKTLEYLAKALPDEDLEIQLTYSPQDIDAEREVEWKKKQKKKPALPDFDQPSHGITPFLADQASWSVRHN